MGDKKAMWKRYVIGVASGVAAGVSGCSEGPSVFKHSLHIQRRLLEENIQLEWLGILVPSKKSSKLEIVAAINEVLGEKTHALVSENKPFLVVGGDHSCAVGTWSGAASALKSKGELGLLYIDAHLDAHTPQTTASGNIHGMPVAALLGYGDKKLTHVFGFSPKIKPENICLVGVRSFESEEKALIERLGVRVYYMEEVKSRGLRTIFQECLQKITQQTVAFGVSLDMDAIDPNDAPATGAPAPHGIAGDELCDALQVLKPYPQCVGIEIAEFDPVRDQNEKTQKLIGELLICLIKQKRPSR